MQKIWLASYPAGVPAEVDVRPYPSLNDMLRRSCQRFADRPAFVNMGVEMTYGELDRLARDFGAYLQGLPGLGKAGRVAIMLPNLLQYPVALFGAFRAGMTVVNVNPLYTAAELEFQLADSGATVRVVKNLQSGPAPRARPDSRPRPEALGTTGGKQSRT